MHHAWNFDFVSTGLPNTTQYPPVSHYQMPDTLYSLVSSYQCSDEVITVGNYINLNRYYDVQDSLRILNDTPGALAFSSSSGPTRDNRVKPDVAATGHHVFSALNLGMQSSQISNSPQTVAQGSLHVIGGGTSASAPVVAGLAALYLQAHPDATNQQVKTAITQCAYTDAFTGNVPNYAWGYGKLDGKAAMVCGENLVQLSTQRSKNPAAYFPNPFREKVIFSLPQPINGHICVYSAEGKLLFEDYFNSKNYELTKADLKNNSPGILFVTITGDDMYYSFKLLQQ
jgi:hypothetical protein